MGGGGRQSSSPDPQQEASGGVGRDAGTVYMEATASGRAAPGILVDGIHDACVYLGWRQACRSMQPCASADTNGFR